MDKLAINHKVCAIIPARGGSKSIKKKNIQCVGGIPLIVRSINAAKGSKFVDRIIVSTDDHEISQLSKENDAEVFDRNPEISNDYASSEAVLIDVLNKIKINETSLPDITVFLQCTSPFINSDDIDGIINRFIETNADSAFSATIFKHFVWGKNKNNSMVGINHNERLYRKRRQDLEQQFLESGSIYVFKSNEFLKYKNRFFGNIAVYTIPDNRSLEIDDKDDLSLADLMSKNF